MKKTIYFLLAFLFLPVFCFSTKAQPSSSERAALGKELYAAANDGKTEIALDLIKRSADLNFLGEYGTPLKRAAFKNNLPLVKALLEAGADPNLGFPALHYPTTQNNARWSPFLSNTGHMSMLSTVTVAPF